VPGPPIEFVEVDPRSPAAEQAARRYFEELAARFEGGFEITAYAAEPTADPGRVVLALRGEEPVACGTVRRLAAGVGEIKRMWVDPATRGVGLGRRMLAHLEHVAAAQGLVLIRLDTNAALVEAISLYDRSGYRRIPRYNDNPYADVWFEKVLDSAAGDLEV
jgi:ribosomal protein S18 acetylase RimI-like enzyme